MATLQNEKKFEHECYMCPLRFNDVLNATNHLKTSHGKKDGDLLRCMNSQVNDMFCRTEFKSIKALRSHMRLKKCKPLSRDVSGCPHLIETDDTSHDAWDYLLGGFDGLIIESSTTTENMKHSLAEYTEEFVNKLIISNIPHSIVNDILKFSEGLVRKITAATKQSVGNNTSKKSLEAILESTEEIVTSQLNKFNSRFKRTNNFARNPNYVAPKTISVENGKTIQYVPILETLEKLFANKQFSDEYFRYNSDHICKDGVYERLCCGQNFKKNSHFQSNPNSIQIQIYFDDVQLTSPLKTKPHKVCAIYFIIRNFPPNFVSKLDNIYLVALCDSSVVDENGSNCILGPLLHDIKILETKGILIERNIDDRMTLKGSLVHVAFDNLGGNTIFEFFKSFNSKYYCRICFLTKKMCRVKTKEVPEKIRHHQHYNDQIEKIVKARDEGTVIKPKDAFGIKQHSMLNELNFFHTIDNRSQDIMHDMYEGVMPFVLRAFFQHLISHGIITMNEIEEKITSFEFGILEQKNTPSKFCIKKKNCNQNASQMHCLMKQLPFIFGYLLNQNENSKRLVVHRIWIVVEYILKIDQIISSSIITETHVNSLENYTDILLTKIKQIFKVHFTPKLHFITHYANTIRLMGPLENLQMMRGDAKHQPFAQYAKRCKNYRNISKTLSIKHQEILAAKWTKNTYTDKIDSSKRMRKVEKNGELIVEFENHTTLFNSYFGEDINQVMLINYLNVNSFIFRKGLFVIVGNIMHQIDAVLKSKNSFVLLCTKFITVKFYKFANCFEIIKSTETLFISYEELVCKRTYEGKLLNDKIQIIADNVDMTPIYEKYIV